MPNEIERKFLIIPGAWHPDPARGTLYRQGYLSVDPARVVRVRIEGSSGFLTIKGRTEGIARPEYEYPLPLSDATELLDRLCLQPVITKRRYTETFAGLVWEIDVFEGANAGLVIAEVELPSMDASFARPAWLGEEVSHDPRYFNANLAQHPFQGWVDHA